VQSHVIKQCVESLAPMRGIVTAYRHTKKSAPNKATYYVELIMKPWLQFLSLTDSVWKKLGEDLKAQWTFQVVKSVTDKY
jgi:hypothetical protein